jgi:hypothetical protein
LEDYMKNALLTITLTLALLGATGVMAQKTNEAPAQSGKEPANSSGVKPMSPGMMDEDMMAMMMQCMTMMEGMMGAMDMKGSGMMNGAGMMGGQMDTGMMKDGGSRK